MEFHSGALNLKHTSVFSSNLAEKDEKFVKVCLRSGLQFDEIFDDQTFQHYNLAGLTFSIRTFHQKLVGTSLLDAWILPLFLLSNNDNGDLNAHPRAELSTIIKKARALQRRCGLGLSLGFGGKKERRASDITTWEYSNKSSLSTYSSTDETQQKKKRNNVFTEVQTPSRK